MELWVADADTGHRLAVIDGTDARSGWLACTVRESYWWPCGLELHLDARSARDARLLDVEVGPDDQLVPSPRLLIARDTGQVWALGPTLGSQTITSEDDRVDQLAVIEAADPVAMARTIDPRPTGTAHDTQTGPGETVMKTLVSRHLGADAAVARRLPHFDVAADQARGTSDTWRPRFQTLVDYLAAVGMTAGVGWQSRWEPGGEDEPGVTVFETLHGQVLDTTVRLSGVMGTVAREEILRDANGRATHVIVAGQGEGTGREVVDVSAGVNAGWRRAELFRDARDVAAGQTSTLQARGKADLAASQGANSVAAVLQEGPGFRYGQHFALGDLLRYRSAWGDDRQARVVAVESTWQESAVPTRTVTLDRPRPDEDQIADIGGTAFV